MVSAVGRHVIAVLLAMGLFVGIAPMVSAAEPNIRSSKDVASIPCTDLLFVGVRGSGEDRPYGSTVAAVREELLARWSGSASSIFLEYPAVNPHSLTSKEIEGLLLDAVPPEPAYFASVDEGRIELNRVWAHARTACPQQKVVVVGFSQGAQVITASLASSPDAGVVSASLLLGNPSHYPGQNIQELDAQVDTPAFGMGALMSFLRAREDAGSDQTRRGRIRSVLADLFALYDGAIPNWEIADTLRTSPGHLIPASSYATTFSVCNKEDLVCDAAPALSRIMASTSTIEAELERTRPAHMGYTPSLIRRSLEAMLMLLAPTGKVRSIDGGPAPTVTISPNATLTPRPRHDGRPTTPSDDADPRRDWVLVIAIVATGIGGYALGRAGRR